MTLRLYEDPERQSLATSAPPKSLSPAATTTRCCSIETDRQGRDTVILLDSAPLPSPLVPAVQARLVVEKGGYHIKAESSGNSLLILPVQFSHCWELAAPAS